MKKNNDLIIPGGIIIYLFLYSYSLKCMELILKCGNENVVNVQIFSYLF